MRSLAQADMRVMPSSLEAEQALLGTVLMDNSTFRQVSEIIKENYFVEPLHRKVWQVVAATIEKGHVASPLTCRQYFSDADLGGVTAGQYLARLASEATNAVSAPDYARTVRDLALRREIISVAQDALDTAYEMPVDVTAESILSEFESCLLDLKPSVVKAADFEDFDDVATRAYASLEEDWRNQGQVRGIPTGYPALDELLGGLEAPDLILIAGRPGSGKTALGTNLALNVARRFQEEGDGRRVGFFSLEMSEEQLWTRIQADATGIAAWRIKRRSISENELRTIADKTAALRRLPLSIDETGRLSIGQLETKARSVKKRKGLDLLIIDYVQLIVGRSKKSGSRDDNRVQELTEITASLKNLAKELQIPIVALAQVGRQVEMRDNKRPMLSDLRESGSLEQDADMVCMIYRHEYYLKHMKAAEGTTAYAEWERAMRRWKGIAEIIVAKQRHGPTGTVEMGFDDQRMRFMNEPEPREEEPEAKVERQKKKRDNLTDKEKAARNILKSLNIKEGESVTIDGIGVVRAVPYPRWKEKCAESLLDDERTEKAAAKFMEQVLPGLKEAGVVARAKSDDGNSYVWLIESQE
jgi:replicative DNA helicase